MIIWIVTTSFAAVGMYLAINMLFSTTKGLGNIVIPQSGVQ